MTKISGKVMILRGGIEIGEFLCESINVKYNSKSKVKRACQLTCSSFPKMNYYKDKTMDYTYPSTDLFPGENTFLVENEIERKYFVFDKIKDRIKVYLNKNDVLSSLGIFMIISSPKTIDSNKTTYDFEMYDETMILEQNQTEDRVFIQSGTSYITAIKQLIVSKGFTLVLNDENSATTQSNREWEIGTNFLDIINELLNEINFNDVHVNSSGHMMLTKKEKSLKPKFIYKKGTKSIIIPKTKEILDIYKVPNVFVGVVSNPDIPLGKFKMINDRFDSIVSTVNRGYEVTKVYKLNNIASKEELEDYVINEFNKSLQQTEIINFSSEIEAGHEFEDMIQLETDTIAGLFKEVEWSIDLSYKGVMAHVIEREVFI